MKKLYYSLFAFFLFFATNAQIINFPDANFKADLLKTGTIDKNGDSEIDVSEASMVADLLISNPDITSLEGINNFINLSELQIRNTQLTSLNVTNLINLIFFNCEDNQLTSLNVSGLTKVNHLVCRNNQLTSLNLSGLTNLQYLDCSSNQFTSLDLSGLTNLQSLECRFNQLTSLDVSGLIALQELLCDSNQLTSLDVSGLSKLHSFYCTDNKLITLFIKNNNTNWISLNFWNNLNLVYICADEEDLEFVQGEIKSYGNSETCLVNSYCSFTPGGVIYTINGKNKIDANTNGCDAADIVYPNLKYTITDGSISGNVISNTSGNYEIPVSVGTHTITPQLENPSYFTVSPANATVTFPTTASPFVQDFCITPNGVYHDLEVVIIPLVSARPGFDAAYKIKYKNKGNVSETATLVLDFEDEFSDYIIARHL